MVDEFPDRVDTLERVGVGGFSRDSSKRVFDTGAMPCDSEEGAVKLIGDSLGFVHGKRVAERAD
jgi:hypothetical protein